MEATRESGNEIREKYEAYNKELNRESAALTKLQYAPSPEYSRKTVSFGNVTNACTKKHFRNIWNM